MRSGVLIVVVIMLTLICIAPPVSASYVDVESTIHIEDDNLFPYTRTVNIANASDSKYSNYNMTWRTFLSEHPEYKGRVITPLLLPAMFGINETIAEISDLNVASRFQLPHSAIMDGIGEWILRLPVENLSTSATVNVHLYRTYAMTNITGFKDNELPAFDQGSSAYELVVNKTFSGSDLIQGFYPISWKEETEEVLTDQSFILPYHKDSYITSFYPNGAGGTEDYMLVGKNYRDPAYPFTGHECYWEDHECRALMWLDPDRTPLSTIPDYSVIRNASWELYAYQSAVPITPSEGYFSAHTIEEPWTESVTWNTQPDHDPDPLSTTWINDTLDVWKSFNITEDYQNVVDQEEWFGTMLITENQTYHQFATHDYGVGQYGPRLRVNYSEPEIYYNFSYLKLWAPLHPDEWYILHFNIDDPNRDQVRLLFSPCDFGDDQVYNTWFDHGDSEGDHTFVQVDLDTSIMALTGMPNGISGMNLTKIDFDTPSNDVYVSHRRTYPEEPTIQASWYASMVMPIVNTSDSDPAHVIYGIKIKSDDSWHTLIWNQYAYIYGTLDHIVESSSMSSYAGEKLQEIQWVLKMNHEYHRIYLCSSENPIVDGGRAPLQIYETSEIPANLREEAWFDLFGYFSVGDVSYTMSNYEIWVIDMEEPEGERNITMALQKFWARIHQKEAEAFFWDLVFGIFGPVLTILKTVGEAIIEWIVEGLTVVLTTIWDILADLGVIDFLAGIGIFLWTVIEVLIDAIEWFGYWGVKIINIFIVGTIYVIGVLTVTTISSGAHKGLKHRSLTALVETLEAGWDRIWAILMLLLSLILFAVSIISAIIPF